MQIYSGMDAMKSKSVSALRREAKTLGIRGYSRMAKSDLVRHLLKAAAAKSAANNTKDPSPSSQTASTQKPNTPTWDGPERQHGSEDARLASEEERVERTKYGTAPATPPRIAPLTDIGEDIDQLPPLREPMLRLLPQKPGVLHVYWVMPHAGTVTSALRLRLCRIGPSGLEVQDEVAVPNLRGTWYFQVPESFDNDAALVQLGEYRGTEFIASMSRGIARIPGRYASDRTDQAWRVNDEDFRRLYLRAGGVAAKQRYVWNSAIGSPTGVAGDGRAQWPGSNSSSPTT
jgi:hypothetical protein